MTVVPYLGQNFFFLGGGGGGGGGLDSDIDKIARLRWSNEVERRN